jgi:hypothetical protein
MQIVGGFAEHERKQDPDTVGEENAERARDVSQAIAFQVRQQRAQTLQQHVGSVDEILAGAMRASDRRGSRRDARDIYRFIVFSRQGQNIDSFGVAEGRYARLRAKYRIERT